MNPHSQLRLWPAVALLVFSACSDDTPMRPEVPEQAPRSDGSILLSRRGLPVPEPRMRALLRQVTREVAVALADAQVRATVYKELHASPYREHKLHFGTFLRSRGAGLLTAMAAVRRGAPEAVLATLDSIVDLEFYVPVKEHFAAWQGGSTLIMASALRDNGTTPDGFDLAGLPVTLSAAEPPATPALVVVPVETNFSNTPARVSPVPVDAATSDIPGVYMTRFQTYSDFEGWPNGGPEFEVHLFQTDVDMEYIDQVCAGEAQSSPYQWNTEETTDWSGSVLLATEGRLALSPNNQFQVWEDDGAFNTDPCTSTGGRPPRAEDPVTLQEMINWASAFVQVVAPGGDVATKIRAVLNAIPAAYHFYVNEADDPVGVLSLLGDCWPEATGPVTFRIYSPSDGHAETGWATLDYRFGAEREPICPLDATISGPVWIESRDGVNNPAPRWTAGVTGGIGSITYAWYLDGGLVSNSSEYNAGYLGGGPWVIRLDVTRGTEFVTKSVNVTVQEVCPGCPESPPAPPPAGLANGGAGAGGR